MSNTTGKLFGINFVVEESDPRGNHLNTARDSSTGRARGCRHPTQLSYSQFAGSSTDGLPGNPRIIYSGNAGAVHFLGNVEPFVRGFLDGVVVSLDSFGGPTNKDISRGALESLTGKSGAFSAYGLCWRWLCGERRLLRL